MFSNQLNFSPLNESNNSFKFDQNEKKVQKSSNEIYQNLLAEQYINKNNKLNYTTQYNHDITKQVNATPLVYNADKNNNKKSIKKPLVLKPFKNKPNTINKNKGITKKSISKEEFENYWDDDVRTKGVFDPNLKTNELNLNARYGTMKNESTELIKTFNQNSYDKIRKNNISNKLVESKLNYLIIIKTITINY